MTCVYSLKDVAFAYEHRPVLTVEVLEVRQGEIVALEGPNGSGKTTLLHLLAFLNIPRQGSVVFFGEQLRTKNLLTFRRRIGLLLQNPYLFRTSVLSNIMSGLKIRGIRGDRAKQAALAALDRVGLCGFEKRHVGSLSGGEAQRVALARAIVLEPEVLLLDEPSNHMDRESMKRTQEIVMELNKKRGKTIVMASHQLFGDGKLANRVLQLFEGRLLD